MAKKLAKSSKKKTAKKKKRRSSADGEELKEFSNYVIKWDDKRVSFTLLAGKFKFYGCWRKVLFNQEGDDEGTAYSIDVWVEADKALHAVESMHYIDTDPRDSTKSLNADICACVNKWLYWTQEGKIKTMEELAKAIEKPTMHFHRSGALDNMIIQLQQFRSTCLRSGGFRALILESDSPNDPKITVKANFTKEAHALDGKVPPLLGAEVTLNQATKRKDRQNQETALPPTDNVQSLLGALEKAKVDGDKSQQRKLRGMLRKVGYRGGLRNKDKK